MHKICSHREFFSETCLSKTKQDYNYHFPIYLAAIGITIGAQCIVNKLSVHLTRRLDHRKIVRQAHLKYY